MQINTAQLHRQVIAHLETTIIVEHTDRIASRIQFVVMLLLQSKQLYLKNYHAHCDDYANWKRRNFYTGEVEPITGYSTFTVSTKIQEAIFKALVTLGHI